MKKLSKGLIILSIFSLINNFVVADVNKENINFKVIPKEYPMPKGTIKASEPKNIKAERISFQNNETGLNLTGIIYKPENFDAAQKYSAVIVTGPMLSVKEQGQDIYAKKLASLGYITMVFDYTYFGESEGEPRYLEDPEMKASDIHSAVTYLLSNDYINSENIAAIGICGSGGYVPYAAVTDSRIKAVISIVPFTVQDEWIPLPLEEVKKARENYEKGIADPTYISLMDSEAEGAAYYYNKDRGYRENWSNLAVSWSEEAWQNYHPAEEVKKWKTPYLVITSENAFTRGQAQELYENAAGQKQLYVVKKAGHFDMYDLEPYVSEAVKEIQKFLIKNFM